MSEQTATKTKKQNADGEHMDPVHVVRRGAIAASIWKRQSPAGYAYYDFSLSRSWKSMSTEKMGYSKNFFETNQAELVEVIQQASNWITQQKTADAASPAPLAA
jgi:hypothetical protein